MCVVFEGYPYEIPWFIMRWPSLAHVPWSCCLVREFRQHVKCIGRRSCEQVRWKYSFSWQVSFWNRNDVRTEAENKWTCLYQNKPKPSSTFKHSGSDGAISCITAFSVASKINCHSVEGTGSDKSKLAGVTCFRFLGFSRCTNFRADRKNVGEKVLKLLADGIIYKVT